MSDGLKTLQLRLVSGCQQSSFEGLRSSSFPLPGEAEFPGFPAMPSALLQLELCLSAPVVDLQDITDIIRADIGLTVQLLRLAAPEMARSPGNLIGISELVVQVGVAKLFALATDTKPLSEHLRVPARLNVCERFWTHSRLTAMIAEELASQFPEVTGEQAYLAGLLCHIGNLPETLGWATAGLGPWHSRHIGYRMAKAWEFPCILRDVIGGYGGVCRTRECCALVDIAEAADNWAARFEALAGHDATRSQ